MKRVRDILVKLHDAISHNIWNLLTINLKGKSYSIMLRENF